MLHHWSTTFCLCMPKDIKHDVNWTFLCLWDLCRGGVLTTWCWVCSVDNLVLGVECWQLGLVCVRMKDVSTVHNKINIHSQHTKISFAPNVKISFVLKGNNVQLLNMTVEGCSTLRQANHHDWDSCAPLQARLYSSSYNLFPLPYFWLTSVSKKIMINISHISFSQSK